jgi:predicted enzyme involved in methoxymalonyl-ACP biosynthesis
MDSVIQIAEDNGIEGLSAEFIRTIKNNQVEHFYKSCGFDVISENQDINKYFIYTASFIKSALTYKKE